MPRFIHTRYIVTLHKFDPKYCDIRPSEFRKLVEDGRDVYLINAGINGWQEIQLGDYFSNSNSVFSQRLVESMYYALD